MATETELWKISELRNRAADALSTGYQASDNGQVSAVPDARSIRYYATLGLVDKPAEMRGRTAYYGRRHLLQLVAIKRLQAKGLKLAEVQSHLKLLDGDALEQLAAVPAYSGPARPDLAPQPSARRESFWNAPVETSVRTQAGGPRLGGPRKPKEADFNTDAGGRPAPGRTQKNTKVETPRVTRPSSPGTLRMQSQLKIELAPGVHVYVDTNKHPNQADRRVLSDAAQGLMDALRACGLHEPQNRRDR